MSSRSPQECDQIRVLVVDTTPMASELLANAVARDSAIQVVGSLATAVEAMEIVPALKPEVVLLSANLDGQPIRGLELGRELRSLVPEVRIVILLDSSTYSNVVAAFHAHASGVFSRNGSIDSLCKCIHSVYHGQVWASSQEMRFVLEALSSTSKPVIDEFSMNLLTKREREVAYLAAEGVKNREIARRLGLSEHTVKNYMFSVFQKLGVTSRVELTRPPSANSNVVAIRERMNGDDTLNWLRDLAKEGLASAQLLLAQIYYEGRGVVCDPTQAYRFLLLAERSNIFESSRTMRKKLAREMSPLQIAEADRQASKWSEEIRRPARRARSL